MSVTLFDRIEALRAALAVHDGDREELHRVILDCGDRYGGIDRLIYAMALELDFAYGCGFGDSGPDQINSLIELHQVALDVAARGDVR
ncbi:hypothetical protein [Rhodococcus maanshanensis]|uniref:hypothetical protein n=1 Tax=Rhodococcus maanshanensis TaxID=183556 RepID=UPI000B8719E0|nr:hypothetical protein [Rhodococcus maanshanensis]